MYKELDLLDKDFSLDNLKFCGILPLRVLGRAMIKADGTAELSTLCAMLYERICELDAKIDGLIAQS